jgi:hypothetical protein
MSISVCVQGLVDEGKINKGQAEDAERIYNQHFHALKDQMGMSAAAGVASERAIAAMKAELIRKKLLAARTVQVRQRIAGELDSYNGGQAAARGGPIDPRAGAALIGGDDRATYSNLEGRRRAIERRAFAGMHAILEKFSNSTLGFARNPAELDNLGREAFGQHTGDKSAAELNQAWQQTAEYLRQRANAAGMDIGKIENWGLPIAHKSRAVRSVDFATWAKDMNDNVDRARMIDNRTGQPFTDPAWDAVLREEFAKIRSDGASHREPGSPTGSSLANQRGEERFFHWKSYDHWKAYNDRYGEGTAYNLMMSHIRGMARDIAQLEILGPNPDATLTWVKDTIHKSAAMDPAANSKAPDRANAAIAKIDRMMAEYTGESRRVANRKLALVGSGIRSWQTAAKLGGAVLSTPSDLAYQFSTRKFNGLPAANMIPQYIKLMASRGSQQEAVRAGLIAERWLSHTGGSSRQLAGEELTGEVAKRLAEGTIRASGLARVTDAGRQAFGQSFLGAITDNSVHTWDKLDPAFRRLFERYGIGEAEWDKIRKTPLEMNGGVPWILPTHVEDHALGDRLLEMIDRETNFAVPEPDLATKAAMSAVGRPGTVAGELFKSSALFKSFGIGAGAMQAHRIAVRAASSKSGAAKYAVGLAIGTGLMGALSLLLRDVILSGQDPRDAMRQPFTDPKTGELTLNPGFWGAAMAQGGGTGPLGDLLQSAEGRAGNFSETLAGPVAGDVGRALALLGSKNRAGDALKLARSEIPGGTNWYTRLAFDRMVADQIQQEIDPNYAQSWRRMEKNADDKGTQYFWRPGDMEPERAPDFRNITKGGH